jgi:hypothetical protein
VIDVEQGGHFCNGVIDGMSSVGIRILICFNPQNSTKTRNLRFGNSKIRETG